MILPAADLVKAKRPVLKINFSLILMSLKKINLTMKSNLKKTLVMILEILVFISNLIVMTKIRFPWRAGLYTTQIVTFHCVKLKDFESRFCDCAKNRWDKVFKSGLSKFFKDCLPQNLPSPLLNTFSQTE